MPSKEKVVTRARVRMNAYEILRRAVETGVEYGYRRAHKHTDTPTEDQFKNEVAQGVMNELCEILLFEEEKE